MEIVQALADMALSTLKTMALFFLLKMVVSTAPVPAGQLGQTIFNPVKTIVLAA